MAAGSLAHSLAVCGFQHSPDRRAARTRHPDLIALDGGISHATVAVLLEEGVEIAEERHYLCFGGRGKRFPTTALSDHPRSRSMPPRIDLEMPSPGSMNTDTRNAPKPTVKRPKITYSVTQAILIRCRTSSVLSCFAFGIAGGGIVHEAIKDGLVQAAGWELDLLEAPPCIYPAHHFLRKLSLRSSGCSHNTIRTKNFYELLKQALTYCGLTDLLCAPCGDIKHATDILDVNLLRVEASESHGLLLAENVPGQKANYFV
jgi:hypothetical protein